MCKPISEGGARCPTSLAKRGAKQRAAGDFAAAERTEREWWCSPKNIEYVRTHEGERMAANLQAEADARAAFCIANGGHRDADGCDFEGLDKDGEYTTASLVTFADKFMRDEVKFYDKREIGINEGQSSENGGFYQTDCTLTRETDGRIAVNLTLGAKLGDEGSYPVWPDNAYLPVYGRDIELSDVPADGPERDAFFEEQARELNDSLDYEDDIEESTDRLDYTLMSASGLKFEDTQRLFVVKITTPKVGPFTAAVARKKFDEAETAEQEYSDWEDQYED